MNEFSKKPEIMDTKKPETENFKAIKPESDMSAKEARSFFDERFEDKPGQGERSKNDVVTAEKPTVDNPYGEDGKLLPDIKYEKNDYRYETDGQGRIIKAEADNLQLKPEGQPRPTNTETPDGKQDGDDKGHLIGDQFGGSNRIDNITPMARDVNRAGGEYYKIETECANSLKEGKSVSLTVEPNYDGDSKRPSSFDVTYSIDGEVKVVSILNTNGGENK